MEVGWEDIRKKSNPLRWKEGMFLIAVKLSHLKDNQT
jgi:hypothetical protein